MRLFAIALGLVLAISMTAEARPRKGAKKARSTQVDKTAKSRSGRADHRKRERSKSHRVAVREDRKQSREERRAQRSGPQSFGLPWNGHLDHATKLRLGDGAHIRRPYRAYGTRSTVEFTRRAITETLEAFPRLHVLAVGDLSAEHGGAVSDHHSHQSGRDVDLGLWYKKKPPGYPDAFINGTDANLDKQAMWTLIRKLAWTANKDGGVEVIFLDYDVQGVIYRWAKKHGVSDQRLERVFQYPRGRGASAIVRHYRNHAHHLHVRFKCAKNETRCSY